MVSRKVICMTREYVYFLFCWEWDEKIDIIQKSRCIQQRVGLKQWETCQQHLCMSAFHVVETALKHLGRIKYGYRRVSNSVRAVTQKRNVLHIVLFLNVMQSVTEKVIPYTTLRWELIKILRFWLWFSLALLFEGHHHL